MVERFFAEITRNRIRRGAFKSGAELQSAIVDYPDNHDAAPKPFVWTKSAGEIREKVAPVRNKRKSQNPSSNAPATAGRTARFRMTTT